MSELFITWLASNETVVVTDRFMHCKTGYCQLQGSTKETIGAVRGSKNRPPAPPHNPQCVTFIRGAIGRNGNGMLKRKLQGRRVEKNLCRIFR
jgi:hypothetical protein